MDRQHPITCLKNLEEAFAKSDQVTLYKSEYESIMETIQPVLATGYEVGALKREIARIKKLAIPPWKACERVSRLGKVQLQSIARKDSQMEVLSRSSSRCLLVGSNATIAAPVEGIRWLVVEPFKCRHFRAVDPCPPKRLGDVQSVQVRVRKSAM